jgi:oligosaccharide repeat unit polymerase
LAKSLFDPYILFLCAAFLFNGGHALLEVFQLNERGILSSKLLPNLRFSPETVLQTLFLVLLGLASFHFGGLLSTSAGSKKKTIPATKKSLAQYTRLVGWGLLLISLIPALFQLRDALTIVMSSGYFALYQRRFATGIGASPRLLATFLIPAALFILVGSKKQRSGIIISGLVVFGYSAFQFFLGARSTAVMPLIAYAWLWHRHIHRIPGWVIAIVSLIMLIVVFPLIHMVRNISGDERLAFSALVNSFFAIDNLAVLSISEMGLSMATVAYTLELVPRLRPFDMGAGYGYALLTLIPNLFWDIHPTIAHGLAADWLVWTVEPAYAAIGGGLGYSFIAEAYLNFGWIGTPLIMGLIGFLFGKFVLWAQRSTEPAKLAMVASFLTFFLLYARGESGSIIRPLIWYSFLPYLLVLLAARSTQTRLALTKNNDNNRGL